MSADRNMTGIIPVGPYRLGEEALSRYALLREHAVHFAMAAGARAQPDYYARLDQRARAAWVEDLGFHLDFLLPVLEEGDLAPFAVYLVWLTEVFDSRGVPTGFIARSLDDFAEFFNERMGAAAAPIVAALAAGKAVLALGDKVPHDFNRLCPVPWPESEAFREAAIKGRHRDASAVLAASITRSGMTLAQAAIHVVQPAMYDVGRLWQQNRLSVAQEHLATALCVTVLAQQMAHASISSKNGLRALFACAAGNHHEVGLRMVANAFELDGWETYFLGANMPATSVIAQVREMKPHLLGLSASLPQHLRGLRETIAALRVGLGKECPKIMIGGIVFNQFPSLARQCHADLLSTDACSAVIEARRLLQDAGGVTS
jgi:MerR family transcriptional regulator, light-induced transcriptional regulator